MGPPPVIGLPTRLALIVTYTAVGYVPYEFERYIVTGKTAPELWNRLAVAKANQWAANLKRARRFIGA